MPIAHSKLTAQGQISVPSEIRRILGVGPGSVIEWTEKNNEVIVRRVGQNTSINVHEVLFPVVLRRKAKTPDVKEGIKKYIRNKHARS